ncbi:MAG: translation initiation factor IF-2 [Phycisphaerales bacterium]
MGKAAVKKRKIFEIAKDLGIESKAIVEKCRAEEVEGIKDHMSAVSAGLEATIREWFSAGEHRNVVEHAAKVDIDAIKAPARKRAAVKRADGSDAPSSGESGVATVESAPPHIETPAAPSEPEAAAPTAPAAPVAPVNVAPPTIVPPAPRVVNMTPTFTRRPQTISENKPAAGTTGAATNGSAPAAPDAGVPGIGKAHRAVRPETPPAPTHAQAPTGTTAAPSAPSESGPSGTNPAVPHGPSHLPKSPAAHHGPPARIEAPKPRVFSLDRPGTTPMRSSNPTAGKVVDPPPMGLVRIQQAPPPPPPAAPAAPAAPGRRGDRPGGSGLGIGGPSAPGAPATPGQPRPRVAAPSNLKIDAQTPAKLSGPKVVRIEQPDFVEAPRSRSDAPRGPRPAGGGADDSKRPVRRSGGGNVPASRTSRRSGRSDVEAGSATWSERDLADREARLNRSEGFLRQRRRDAKIKEQVHAPGSADQDPGGIVQVIRPYTIKDLAAAAGIKSADIVKKLFLKGIMASPNQAIEDDQAIEIMMDWDIELQFVEDKTEEELVAEEYAGRESQDIRTRSPVVTILGHVDHGKTSLLDKIRNTNIAAGEAGGITQSTRAFRTAVNVEDNEKWVCFLDTPGHQAFSEMRARGANMTDVIVLVVSVVDGVMPQTIESINHAKAAKAPIIVALNKIDMPGVNESLINKVYGQLAEQGLNPSAWGGDTDVVHTSATVGTGIQELLETIDYRAQVLDLKAGFEGPARGVVIEAKMEEGRGPVANVLMQDGCLSIGDILVAGRAYGRVRDIINDRGEKVKKAQPSTPVLVSGLTEIPNAGDKFYIVDSMRHAAEVAEQRAQNERMKELATPKLTLDSMFKQLETEDVKELRVVLKADVQGSVDVIAHTIEQITTEKVKVRVLHAAVGGVNESDVTLAAASKAIIVGFNVIPSGKARGAAESKGVEVRTYDVIYNIVDDIKLAAQGLLAPILRQEVLGHAEVRQVFKVSRVGAVAGCYVTDGVIERNALIRVTRNGIVIEKDRTLEQLKRFKDDAKEVKANMECGMKIAGYDDIKEGDVLECYKNVEMKQTL